MSKIIFNSKGVETTIQSNKNEKMKEIINKLATKINLDLNKAYFIYNGKIVNEKLGYEELMNETDKARNIMNIIIGELNLNYQNENIENMIKSKEIICPKCKEQTFIKLHDYLINLEDCENGHNLNELSIKDFKNSQNIDMTKIICNFCKDKNMSNTYQNEMHFCYTCGNYLCPLHKSNHDQMHKIVKFEEKNLFCSKHKERFTQFCFDCEINLCMKCEREHQKHKTVNLGEFLPNDDILKEMNEFKEYLDNFNIDIKDIINKLENVLNNVNEYYNISNNFIVSNLDNRNYQILKNINEFINYNTSILNDIKAIINENNIENKIKNIMNIYDKININNHKNVCEKKINSNSPKLIYNNFISADINIEFQNINQEIRIINSFEQSKLEHNNSNSQYDDYWKKIKNENDYFNEKELKNKCIIKINDDIIPFSFFHKFSKIGKYKIQYIFVKNMKNINCMFADCNFLKNIDLSNFNSDSITSMDKLFFNCHPISINMPNFSANNITIMKKFFYNMNGLMNLNLSDFNAKNVTDMSEMFYNCYCLKTLNLTNFITKNVTDMKSMFYNCSSLASLNLSSFNTEKVIDMSNMFSSCRSLKSLNLTNFNTKNVADMSNMFYGCISLQSLNIDNFNTKNVLKFTNMFYDCKLLKNLNVDQFQTENVVFMNCMFCGCNSLQNINLTNFNTSNVTNMEGMFAGCNSLQNLNLSNFNTSNVTNMRKMFSGCVSLSHLNISNFKTTKVHTFYSKYRFEGSTFFEYINGALNGMFYNCKSLKKSELITKDRKIKEEYDATAENCVIF